MATVTTTHTPAVIDLSGGLPDIITSAGDRTAWRFVEFVTATIRNPNTREAYARAVGRFLAWCEGRGLEDLRAIRPVIVAAYIEQLEGAAPTVKQHLSAIRQCFDWLVSGGVLEVNPAASVTERPMHRNDVIRMIKRRSRGMAVPPGICCHTFCATGITAYLENGGTIEKAQAIAAHESPRTTKLYDRTDDAISLDEIERILI